ncbi:hypothetical protein DOTSEDRAFT_27761 [Dothistroma septosporum NZE10]|uniref:Uncharacterized protein n=1 Tax=Dothistroma septosporum (strain NZE10 / CBS 128990) TaxID=675120 RepID=N1PBV1_DOTSN|nr:hypothetical protein DOTSEDRAFT_27761 [Dothistroma septosporum NZE10]
MTDLHKDIDTTRPQTKTPHTPSSPSSAQTQANDSSVPIATRWVKAQDAGRNEGKEFAEARRSSAAGPRRSSVASGKPLFVDKEKEQRDKVQRLLEHHWVPSFLK